MDLIFRIAGIGIVIAIIGEVLDRAGRKEQALMVTLAGIIVVLIMVSGEIATLFDLLRKLFDY